MGNVPTTTSLKVAEYFDKEHRTVLANIRTLIDGGVQGFMQTPYVHPQNGQTYNIYTMDRRAFMILTMGFAGDRALEFKQNFMDAFEGMEEELAGKRFAQFEIPKTLSEALMFAAKQAEQLELQAPKVEAHDAYLDTDSNMSLTEAAKWRQPN